MPFIEVAFIEVVFHILGTSKLLEKSANTCYDQVDSNSFKFDLTPFLLKSFLRIY